MIYQWECPACHQVREVYSSIAERNTPQLCDAGHDVTAMERVFLTPPIANVVGTVENYRAVTGDVALKGERPIITSKRAHQAFLKRNRLIEVGTDKPKDTRAFRPIHSAADRAAIRREVTKQVRKVIAADKAKRA